jgi:ribosomal protein L7/L12
MTNPKTTDLLKFLAEFLESNPQFEVKVIDFATGDVTFSVNPSIQEEYSAEEMDCMVQGRKIEAIKAYRTPTGASLYDAKVAIENYMNRPRVPF